ncbi:CoA transferase [Fictibacillus aquaticus]|uniref:CoA transferase n=1 Tax=Fictibacillus aquaticus TaxID=2021314 RepID=A0A235F9A9_9BACL|nr:CaiB/BaiF CoA-transferase family protein [Fictibacillus aquaticus]OYD57759.1 CoA transferase [Fictibacillus aquaticus]
MLEGVTVLDFSHYLPGPFATLRLAELGAEVIKVEPPAGDPARFAGGGLVFQANNRDKKSITLNLKHESAREIALRLVRKADVLIESFRPGVLAKLGLGFDEAAEVNPKLVYCSISGYGQDSMMSSLGSHDINYMALSGALAQMKDEHGRPVHPSSTFADFIGGMAATERILAGLVSRGLTGRGSYHSISITEAVAAFMVNHVMAAKKHGTDRGIEVLNGSVVCYALYETSDNRFVSLGALEPKFWRSFCEAVRRPDWISLQYSSTDSSAGEAITELFKSQTLQHWTKFGMKTDCCMAPVLEAGELASHPYFMEKGTVFGDGQVRMHSGIEAADAAAPPEKGEHTDIVLKEWLGVSNQELLTWRSAGMI